MKKVKKLHKVAKETKGGGLSRALSVLKKYFPTPGDVAIYSDSDRSEVVAWIRTPSKRLNEALGGGVPIGRLTEIAGGESSGKTTLVLQIIAAAQEMGLVPIFVDAENALDRKWVINSGTDPKKLIYMDVDTIEDFFLGYRALCSDRKKPKKGEKVPRYLIVLDSVPALPSAADLRFYSKNDKKKSREEHKESQPGNQARSYSNYLKKAVKDAARFQDAIVFINQLRDNMNAMAFGQAHKTPGGRAIKFHASIRVYCVKIKTLRRTVKGESVAYGVWTQCETVKNKLAAPFQRATLEIEFGGRVKGISNLKKSDEDTKPKKKKKGKTKK